MLFLRITGVESLRIRGLENSSARTCESNKGVFSNLELQHREHRKMLPTVTTVKVRSGMTRHYCYSISQLIKQFNH